MDVPETWHRSLSKENNVIKSYPMDNVQHKHVVMNQELPETSKRRLCLDIKKIRPLFKRCVKVEITLLYTSLVS
jgi:hypothetical protein